MSTAVIVSDQYTGDVSPDPDRPEDSPVRAQRRRLAGVDVVKMSVGPMDNNVYVITDRNSGASLLIDAANDADEIMTLLRELGTTPDQIVTTHGHYDHWQALAEISNTTSAVTAIGAADAPDVPVPAQRLLNDGDTVVVGSLTLDVIGIVGHTKGSVALAFTDGDGRVHLFTGDSLFPGGVGKTWQPGDFEILLDEVSTKLFDRYDDAVVYPGHGKDTTLGTERPNLPEWRERGW
ncbi:MAG: MBL fold metallo-hydrolase [Gordonia sp. (in: high G+C Gram-positive bacteria)]